MDIQVGVHDISVEADGAALLDGEVPLHQVQGREMEVALADGVVAAQAETALRREEIDRDIAVSAGGEGVFVAQFDMGREVGRCLDAQFDVQFRGLLGRFEIGREHDLVRVQFRFGHGFGEGEDVCCLAPGCIADGQVEMAVVGG